MTVFLKIYCMLLFIALGSVSTSPSTQLLSVESSLALHGTESRDDSWLLYIVSEFLNIESQFPEFKFVVGLLVQRG